MLRLLIEQWQTVLYRGKPFLLTLAVSLLCFFTLPVWHVLNTIWFDFTGEKFVLLLLIFALIITLCVTSFRFLYVFYCLYKVQQHLDEIERGRVVIYEGAPGTGKTVSMTFDGYYMALYAWRRLKGVYGEMAAEYRNRCAANVLDLADYWDFSKRYFVIRDAYEFYKKNLGLPCLFSNYPVRRNYKERHKLKYEYSYQLQKEHFIQTARLPEGAVCLLDESADILSNQRSTPGVLDDRVRAENDAINEFASKERHFLDAYLFFAEQCNEENFIGVRRVVSINRYLTENERVCSPRWLQSRLDKQLRKVEKRGQCSPRRLRKIKMLRKKVSRIGFLKIRYEDRGNNEKSRKVLREDFYCLPCKMPFRYETRAYMFQYRPINRPLKCVPHSGLYIRKRI